jgi:hypothetical protein
VIKCPECKKDVSESAVACPSCGYPISKTVTDAEKAKEKLEKKKGCGGCLGILGILILIGGLATFIGARKSAGDLIQADYENRGIGGAAAADALARAAGHGSYADYLTEQNRSSGMLFTCIGVGIGIVGYRMYNARKT